MLTIAESHRRCIATSRQRPSRLLCSLATLFASLFCVATSFAQLPPPVGPVVWGGYTQNQLDATYDQDFWDNDPPTTGPRSTMYGNDFRARYGGEPERFAYGPSQYERLDLFRTNEANYPAPIMVFVHGGAWRGGSARGSHYYGEMFNDAGAHYISLDFVNALQNNGNLMEMGEQVRRALVWVYSNAASFGGDRDRIYISGHSSGGHLCGVLLTTDWATYNWNNHLGAASVPYNMIKGGLCFSGMYELFPVSLSARRLYVNFTPETIEELSAQRRMGFLTADVVLAYASKDSPEFIRQSKDFAAALAAQGRNVKLLVGEGYNHFEMPETLGNPYGLLGRAALELMGLSNNGGLK